MPLARRIDVVWTGLPGGPYLTRLIFENVDGNAGVTATAVQAFLTALKPNYANTLTATQQSDQEIFDVVTGLNEQLDSVAAQAPVLGGNTSTANPYATQGLVRLRTALFNSGKRLQGRVYIPGTTTTTGCPLPTGSYITAVDSAANGLRTAMAGSGPWSVWSRRYGAISPVNGVSTWNNYGVQRRRRD